VESELLAFLSDAPPPPAAPEVEELEEIEEILPVSEGMIAVPDLPPLERVSAPPRPVSIPTLASSAPAPGPIISERPRTLPVATPSASRPAPAVTISDASKPAIKNPLLIDVTPLSLGVETVGGFCDIIIRANSPVPCDRNRSFRTASDGQTAVTVRVCQGESDRFDQNVTLGDLRLTGFRSAPRGEIEITVTFEIDADGILNVEAAEVQSGRKAIARIELLGAQMDPKRMEAMIDRQARHEVA
jgi:molecular chaperone DnaK